MTEQPFKIVRDGHYNDPILIQYLLGRTITSAFMDKNNTIVMILDDNSSFVVTASSYGFETAYQTECRLNERKELVNRLLKELGSDYKLR